ncbi:MAG: hypothetical protein WBF04_21535 [Candidatus Sulfotelmatobacter sp.]
MSRCPSFLFLLLRITALVVSLLPSGVLAQASSPSAPTAPKAARTVGRLDYPLDAGTVTTGVYRNKTLALSCRIPAAWVLRTEEMNARDAAEDSSASPSSEKKDSAGRVLLAAFSRPPEARAEDVNSSIVIAAESVATYPGLKEAAQYFGPLSEVAKAQGFMEVEEPYEFVVGTRTLARGDFQKDVGSRVMRQSTLVLLARGWAVSITFIGGTENEVEELIGGLSFASPPQPK